jgi:hypothetical protein
MLRFAQQSQCQNAALVADRWHGWVDQCIVASVLTRLPRNTSATTLEQQTWVRNRR